MFTTNFDPLIEDATLSANAQRPVAMQRRPTVAGIDSAERALRCLNESDWPLVAKLHGDYQEISIKNTGAELEKQDERMRHVLVEASKRFGMVFVGYSGRDASVMDALSSVLNERAPFPNGLYWMASSVSRLLPAVTEFLTKAQEAGVDVAVVECATFDELAAEVIRAIDLPSELQDHIMKARPNSRLIPSLYPRPRRGPFQFCDIPPFWWRPFLRMRERLSLGSRQPPLPQGSSLKPRNAGRSSQRMAAKSQHSGRTRSC